MESGVPTARIGQDLGHLPLLSSTDQMNCTEHESSEKPAKSRHSFDTVTASVATCTESDFRFVGNEVSTIIIITIFIT